MNKLIIKICGITELPIARFLVEKNVDIMGFIFYSKSPRYILPEMARRILNKLGNKRKKIRIAGVFVNEGIKNIISIAELLKLDYIQLHGTEKPEFIDKLNDFSVIKAFRVDDKFSKEILNPYKNKNIKYFLIDTFQKDHPGGTGKVFNWNRAAFLKSKKNIIISGGLNRDNLLKAIDFFQPTGIDLNSGVEKSPGLKSRKRIEEILIKIRKLEG